MRTTAHQLATCSSEEDRDSRTAVFFITKGSGKERRIEKFLTLLWGFGFSSGKEIVALFLF